MRERATPRPSHCCRRAIQSALGMHERPQAPRTPRSQSACRSAPGLPGETPAPGPHQHHGQLAQTWLIRHERRSAWPHRAHADRNCSVDLNRLRPTRSDELFEIPRTCRADRSFEPNTTPSSPTSPPPTSTRCGATLAMASAGCASYAERGRRRVRHRARPSQTAALAGPSASRTA